MEDSTQISKQLAILIELFKKNGEAHKRPEEKPRDVVTRDTGVIVDGLSDNVKKFFTSLFKFEQPDVKKQIDKKTHFWSDILTLLGAALYGVYKFFKDNILSTFEKMKDFFNSLKDLFIGFKNWFKDTSAGKVLENFWLRFKNLFSEEGFIGKFFSKEKFLAAFLARTTILTNFFKNIFAAVELGMEGLKPSDVTKVSEKIFVWIGNLLGKAFEIFTPFMGKIKFLGTVLSKIAWPIQILLSIFEYKAGYEDEMKRGTKDTIIAKMKGAISFFTSILTLGFINFEDIKKSINRIVENFKQGNVIKQFIDVVLLIPESIGKAIYKGITWLISWFNTDATNIMTDKMKSFSLSEYLEDIGSWWGELVVDTYTKTKQKITSYIEKIYNSIEDAFSEFFDVLYDFIDKIIHFDYSKILKKIPGYETITKWFTDAAPAQKNNIQVAPNQAQDYISRPGQPIQSFSSKDTVIAFKEGGPILDVLTQNTSFTKKFNEISVKYYSEHIKLLSEVKSVLDEISQNTQNNKTSNVVVNNKTNHFNLPEMTTTTQFRQNFLGGK